MDMKGPSAIYIYIYICECRSVSFQSKLVYQSIQASETWRRIPLSPTLTAETARVTTSQSITSASKMPF